MDVKIGYILVLGMLLGLAACETKPGSKGILGINDMKLVMYDIVLVDEYVYNNVKRDSTNAYNDTLNRKYQQVFKLHNIDQETFFTSYEFYNTHPEYYNTLMDSLQNYSNRKREVHYQENENLPQAVTDTVPVVADTLLDKSIGDTSMVLKADSIPVTKKADSQDTRIQERFKEMKNKKELMKSDIKLH